MGLARVAPSSRLAHVCCPRRTPCARLCAGGVVLPLSLPLPWYWGEAPNLGAAPFLPPGRYPVPRQASHPEIGRRRGRWAGVEKEDVVCTLCAAGEGRAAGSEGRPSLGAATMKSPTRRYMRISRCSILYRRSTSVQQLERPVSCFIRLKRPFPIGVGGAFCRGDECASAPTVEARSVGACM